MTSEPLVSVCLLTYRRAAQLPATLDSLLRQDYRNLELIINDDRSPDDTERICRAYEARDGRVRYCKNATNRGYAGNQNEALVRATAEFVAIVHDGDVYRPDLIRRWVQALQSQPSAALVFNALDAMDDTGRIVGTFRHPYGPLVAGRKLAQDMVLRPDSPIWGIVMVRKSCVQEVGPFDERFRTLADVDMWMRLLARFDAAYIAEPLLAIAPREMGHHNHAGNWRVRWEYETIHRDNFSRLFGPAAKDSRRSMERMLRRERWRAVGWCLRRGKWRAFADGLVYSIKSGRG